MALHIILNSNNIQPRVDRKTNELYLVRVEFDSEELTIIHEQKFKPDPDVWKIKQMLLLPLANLVEMQYTVVIESEEGQWVKWVEKNQEWVRTNCPNE